MDSMSVVEADFPSNRRAPTSSTQTNSDGVVHALSVVINFCPKYFDD
jgi:hypothetical protein